MEIKRLEANVNQYSNTAVRLAVPLKFIYLNKVYHHSIQNASIKKEKLDFHFVR